MTPADDLTWAALKMVVALVVVLGGMGLCYWVVRRWLPTQANASRPELLRLAGCINLGPKTRICMVEVPGRILVIGLTGHQVTLLSEITDSESLKKIQHTLSQAVTGSFLQQLRSITTKPAPDSGSPKTDSEDTL